MIAVKPELSTDDDSKTQRVIDETRQAWLDRQDNACQKRNGFGYLGNLQVAFGKTRLWRSPNVLLLNCNDRTRQR